MENITTVYVINLKKDAERRARMEGNLSQAGIHATFVQGIYGKDLTIKEREETCTPFCAKFCTPGAIGCGLSHKKVWQMIVEKGEPASIVMEDDIVFHPEFKEVLVKVFHDLPSQWDYVYLGCLGACDINRRYDVFDTALSILGGNRKQRQQRLSDTLFVPDAPTGTHCYMISQAGAKKLLRLIPKIYQHIDISILPLFNQLNIYATNPQIAMQESINIESSNIITGKYPAYVNTFLDTIKDKNVGYGYKLSCPVYNIYGYDLNLYTAIFVIIGVVLGLSLRHLKGNRRYLAVIAILILFNLPEIKYLSRQSLLNLIINNSLALIVAGMM